jgi:hypothetical protein
MNDLGNAKRTRRAPISEASDPNIRLNPKRDRDDDIDGSDNDQEGDGTPQASRAVRSHRSRPIAKRTSPSRASVSTSCSPNRKLDSLSLNNKNFDTRQLGMGDERQPKALQDMLYKVNTWKKWKGILHWGMKAELGDDLRKYGLDAEDAYSKDEYGSSLPRTFVVELMEDARECHERYHAEIAWNFEVHHQLLERTFRAGKKPHLVNFSAWYVLIRDN